MQKTKKIEFPMYHRRIFIVYTDDMQKARESYDRILGKNNMSYKYVDGLCCYNEDDLDIYIFFTNKSYMSSIAHECSHAIWRMFKHMGAEFEDELFAYNLGYLFEKAFYFKQDIDNKLENDTSKQGTEGRNQI